MESKQKIAGLLLQLGMTPEIRGFHYLVDAIAAWMDAGTVKPSLTKVIYPDIAKTCGRDSRSVERNIRHAIDSIGFRVPFENVAQDLGVNADHFPNGFKIGQFVALCALKIEGGQNGQ